MQARGKKKQTKTKMAMCGHDITTITVAIDGVSFDSIAHIIDISGNVSDYC